MFDMLLCIYRVIQQHQHTVPGYRSSQLASLDPPQLELQSGGTTAKTAHIFAPHVLAAWTVDNMFPAMTYF